MAEVRLITLDPGHFHTALVQKEMYPGVAKQAHRLAHLEKEHLLGDNGLAGGAVRVAAGVPRALLAAL